MQGDRSLFLFGKGILVAIFMHLPERVTFLCFTFINSQSMNWIWINKLCWSSENYSKVQISSSFLEALFRTESKWQIEQTLRRDLQRAIWSNLKIVTFFNLLSIFKPQNSRFWMTGGLARQHNRFVTHQNIVSRFNFFHKRRKWDPVRQFRYSNGIPAHQ